VRVNTSSKDQRETDPLSDADSKALWKLVRPFMYVSDDQSIENALSGDDPFAARSYIFWLHRRVSAGEELDDDVRAFATTALARFLDGDAKTLGVGFGVERAKRGHPPARLGGVQAVNGLIRCLSEDHGYPLGDSSGRPSAFEVAAQLLRQHFRFDRSPYTLRDQYWSKRERGK
jgi:hypothetical protein